MRYGFEDGAHVYLLTNGEVIVTNRANLILRRNSVSDQYLLARGSESTRLYDSGKLVVQTDESGYPIKELGIIKNAVSIQGSQYERVWVEYIVKKEKHSELTLERALAAEAFPDSMVGRES